jgi:hypothetical protein
MELARNKDVREPGRQLTRTDKLEMQPVNLAIGRAAAETARTANGLSRFSEGISEAAHMKAEPKIRAAPAGSMPAISPLYEWSGRRRKSGSGRFAAIQASIASCLRR